MVFNVTFNNISVILWRSVLLLEATGVPGENHWQTLSHNVISSTPRHERHSNAQPFCMNLAFHGYVKYEWLPWKYGAVKL
jgi:hypothetical protein